MQCKLRERIRSRSFNEKLEGSSLRGGASRKITTGISVAGRQKKLCIRVKPEMAQGMAVNPPKAPGRGARLKASRHGYNQEKN